MADDMPSMPVVSKSSHASFSSSSTSKYSHLRMGLDYSENVVFSQLNEPTEAANDSGIVGQKIIDATF